MSRRDYGSSAGMTKVHAGDEMRAWFGRMRIAVNNQARRERTQNQRVSQNYRKEKTEDRRTGMMRVVEAAAVAGPYSSRMQQRVTAKMSAQHKPSERRPAPRRGLSSPLAPNNQRRKHVRAPVKVLKPVDHGRFALGRAPERPVRAAEELRATSHQRPSPPFRRRRSSCRRATGHYTLGFRARGQK
ncbi:uncharacterized protein K452DRAFT_108765 [Aplosporella prunicola CBS 121167]|uniref:Uncharacterized protein n=1 Tax=Aplosporella prunicola CBS 121167 TaxID=1176127 RepID=A0A6A6BQA9_9PEZI|nr:uncharacterized protein K452DRAFT_108765 [Aplosporella prunicola CBS 121167]KAF2146299.1 hypothetical protein K452DRAFT_108765 [Aplosporella prunicola CBS 121167]